MGSARSDEPRDGLDDTIRADDTGQPAATRKSSPTVPPPAGEERYQIRAELGRGGMGRVVEALDIQLGRIVALKEVLPKAGNASARRFAREVALTARLEHPSIVPLYDSGTTADGRPYYVMRRVSGRPLDELIARARKLEDRLAYLPAVQSAIDAVAHAHRRGVIHRDLKPANILVGDLGETVVIDWGLAKVIGEEDDPASRDSLPSDSLQTQMGSVFGTPGFMAPEQARGEEISTHGDVYALGATLYQLLAGTPPHAGNSATEVLDKTLRHHMVPLAEIAPGAPAELVTIVNKALSHEPRDRYPDAAALGEDVRRFLTGQLVAAHRYTPRQRVVRFARRHRAALTVTALASVALAVLAWISVARIMQERDAANVARARAVAQQRAAEQANRELAVRHDALLVARARARVDVNPTEALATLKLLPADSSQLAEARAVAQAAVLRGVTWAIQSTFTPTLVATMSADAKRLLQVSFEGNIRVWNVDRRVLEFERRFPKHSRAVWIAGGKLLVTHRDSPPAILDPATNTLESLTIDPIDYAIPSATGEHVVFHGAHGAGAGVLEVATRRAKVLSTARISTIAIAPDGKALAWVEPKATVIADPAGAEIARLGVASRIAFSRARMAAAIVDGQLFELALDAPNPALVPISLEPQEFLVDVFYRGREVVVWSTRLRLWGWDGKRSYAAGRLESLTTSTGAPAMQVVDGDFLVALSSDNKVQFRNLPVEGTVQLPANLKHARLVTTPDSSRVLIVAAGVILGFDLATVRPRRTSARGNVAAEFADDDTLLVYTTPTTEWHWMDLHTGATTAIAGAPNLPISIMGIEGGRVLVDIGIPLIPDKPRRIVLLEKGKPTVTPIVESASAWACLVPGNVVAYSPGGGRVMAIVDGGPPRELVKVEGRVAAGVPIGHRRLAIHSSSGELVRIDIATGKIERTTIAPGARFAISGDLSSGRVALAEDGRILLWDRTVTELATFDRRVEGIAMLDGVLAVWLQGNELYLVELKPNVPPRRVFAPSQHFPVASADGKLLIGVGNIDQLEVLELPSRTRWTTPRYPRRMGRGTIVSPSRRRVLLQTTDALTIVELPLAPADDFASWLDEQTNATVGLDGDLQWPWQTTPP